MNAILTRPEALADGHKARTIDRANMPLDEVDRYCGENLGGEVANAGA